MEKEVLMVQLLHTPVITAVYCPLLVIKLHLDAFIHSYAFSHCAVTAHQAIHFFGFTASNA